MTPLLASSLALSARLGALQSLRFDVPEICRRAGIDEKSITDPHHFVPESTIWAVWREAAAQRGTQAWGLRAGAIVPFGTYGVLNYLSMTARTLGEGLHLLARYWPLIGTGKRLEIASDRGGTHRLRYIQNAPLAGQSLQCRDYTLAVMTNHMFARSGLRPSAVEFEGPPIAPASEYGDLLGTRARFDQAQTAMVFSDREWNSELPGQDALLIRTLEEHASNRVRRIPSNTGIGARAAREIAWRLRDGNLSLTEIARSLAMSERTLQRHLNLEGYTFEGLVDAVRREAATELLKDSGLSVTEIGYLIGYSGPAAFHRAYKRWTGEAPRRAGRKATS